MSKRIVWDNQGERLFETGVDRGVLYTQTDGVYDTGVPWNGLTAVTEAPSGAEPTPLYADNIKYLELMSVEEFAATIEAYTYPEEFEACDGSATLVEGITIGQQPRKSFGFSYRTKLGNDDVGDEYGYKIHLVYGAKASPSDKGYETINESPDAITFSWEITTTPVEIPGHKPSASLTIDSTKVSPETLKKLEDLLYGGDENDPTLPTPEEILTLINGEEGGA